MARERNRRNDEVVLRSLGAKRICFIAYSESINAFLRDQHDMYCVDAYMVNSRILFIRKIHSR